MPRISAHEKLKPTVIAKFTQGLQPTDLYREFREIPPRTMRDWYAAWQSMTSLIAHSPNKKTFSNLEEISKGLGEILTRLERVENLLGLAFELDSEPDPKPEPEQPRIPIELPEGTVIEPEQGGPLPFKSCF